MPQNNNGLVLEILGQGETFKMSLFEQRELSSTLRHYSQCQVSLEEVDKLCREAVSVLSNADSKGQVSAGRFANLKKIGQLLWDQLLTGAVKERLKNRPNSDLILSIDEELINIPWEILYDGQEFLCLKFSLGRLIRTKEQKSPVQYRSLAGKLKMLVLANPTNDLKSAYLEGTYIKNQFDGRRKDIGIDFKSTHINTLYVKKVLRDYDIVHFAGHCDYDPDNEKNTGWVLDDGRLNTHDIHAMGESSNLPTLIFSNACYSAKVSKDFSEQDCQRKTYSLASSFLFSGVRHYIGTIRRIEDSASLVFAKEFYSQLISGKAVGESLRLGRLKLIKEYGMNSVSWASYLLYGDPNFGFFKPKTELQLPKPRKNFSAYRKLLTRASFASAIISICVCLYIWLPSLNPNSYVLFLKSRSLFQQGRNQDVIGFCSRIIQKDPLFLKAYPLLADTYHRIGDRNNTLKYYFEYELLSEKRQDRKNLASAYIGLGWIYHLHGEYANALDFYNKAINLSADNKDALNESIALRKLAIWHIDRDENDRALELLIKTSEIDRERQYMYEHRYNLACDYFDIGLVFVSKHDFITAKEFYTKSRLLFEKLKLKEELSDCYFKLGEICLFEKQYQKAKDYYTKGLGIDQAQDNKYKLAGDYNMMGALYVSMDNLPEAESSFNQAALISKQLGLPLESASAYHNLGLIYKHRGQKNKTREYFRQAQEIYLKIDLARYQQIKQEFLDLTDKNI